MARNAEKAMTTLARWRAAQVRDKGSLDKDRRPYLATECNDLPKAEKWRMQIIREIARKVSQIQNAGLGEFRIRDLNDEINKLIREKSHWEAQIKDLGGKDYARVGPKMFDNEGREVPGNRGYKYFGAAKDLPGVRELFEQEPPVPSRKSRPELMRDVDADYYGYRDDDDGILIRLEQVVEMAIMEQTIDRWSAETAQESQINDDDLYITRVLDDDDHDNDGNEANRVNEFAVGLVRSANVPSQKDIEQALLMRKKKELLEKYVSDHTLSNEAEIAVEENCQ